MENQFSILNEIAKNIPSIITGLTAVLTAFFAGLFTWLISKNQIKIRIKELDINNEFNARKLIYEEYAKSIEMHIQSVERINQSLSQLYSIFVLEGYEKVKNEMKIFCDSSIKIIAHLDNPIQN